MPKKVWLLTLVLIWIFYALWPKYTLRAADLWVLDVGQGESIFMHEPSGKTLLFDGGPTDQVLSELGKILPVWEQHIDLVILSHNHADHLQGLLSVVERYQIGAVWLNGSTYRSADFDAFSQALKDHHLEPRIVWFDWQACTDPCPPVTRLGQFKLQVYHPLVPMLGKVPRNPHDASLVVKVSYQSESVLLTGDLDEAHEAAMLADCAPPHCSLRANALQAPHHGSATGMLPAFLVAVNPQVALIPAGLNNSFGLPAASTLAKLKTAGIPTYRTDTMGRVQLTLYSDHLRAKAAKFEPP